MTRRMMVVGLLAALAFATAAGAHEDFRIVGTVVRASATKLDVKQTKDGKTIAMRMNGESLVTRDKVKVALAELKPGLHVVVDATGDSLDDLLVLEVRLVPPPTKR